MLTLVRTYVKFVDGMNRFIGRIAMLLIFAIMAILMYSVISKNFFEPSLMTLEIAQFTMVAYFLLGGPYSMQMGDHVRMDLLYGGWSDMTKAAVGAISVTFATLVCGRLNYHIVENTARKTRGISCMLMWNILAALPFDKEFDGLGAVKAKVVQIFKDYNETMVKAGRPYRYS